MHQRFGRGCCEKVRPYNEVALLRWTEISDVVGPVSSKRRFAQFDATARRLAGRHRALCGIHRKTRAQPPSAALNRQKKDRSGERAYQTTKAQSTDSGRTATPRYIQVRYAPASLGRMKRLTISHAQTPRPNSTRMRSPGVSYTDQKCSIWGLATRAVSDRQNNQKKRAKSHASKPDTEGRFWIGFSCRIRLICLQIQIGAHRTILHQLCPKTYLSPRCSSKRLFYLYGKLSDSNAYIFCDARSDRLIGVILFRNPRADRGKGCCVRQTLEFNGGLRTRRKAYERQGKGG